VKIMFVTVFLSVICYNLQVVAIHLSFPFWSPAINQSAEQHVLWPV